MVEECSACQVLLSLLAYCTTLNMETVCSSEILGSTGLHGCTFQDSKPSGPWRRISWLAERLLDYKGDFAQITVHSVANHFTDKAKNVNMSLELSATLKINFIINN
jgi:hypothetical protein